MDIEDYLELARRSWVSLLVALFAGAAAAGLAAGLQDVTYTSSATTTVVNAPEKVSVESAYSITQAIRVTMPAYVAESTGVAVMEAAEEASGLPSADLRESLTTSRDPDSTVILWTLSSPSAVASQEALAAAVETFGDVVRAGSPLSSDDRPLITVTVNQEASVASPSRSVPISLATVAGGAAGLLGALLVGFLRARWDHRITSRESIELGLTTPVVAELPEEQEGRARAWSYVAGYLVKHEVSDPVLVLTADGTFSEVDQRMLRAAVEGLSSASGPHVMSGKLIEAPDLSRAVLRAGAVMLVLTRRVDDLAELRPVINSVGKVSRGPVFAVLELGRFQRARFPRSSSSSNGRRSPEEWTWDDDQVKPRT